METTVNVRKQPKYWAISIAAIMATAFVLVQPAMQASYAVTDSALVRGGFDDCTYRGTLPDPLTMNSVKNGQIVKTIISEKEVYDCFLNQGNIAVIVDVTQYVEIFENITSHDELAHNVTVGTCLKDPTDGTVIDCESNANPIDESTTPVGTSCVEQTIDAPAEMNTVNKGKLVKTIEVQKEQFLCDLTGTQKKVDVYLITDIFEDLGTQTVSEVTFQEVRCVVQVFDSDPDTDGAHVESCTFKPIPN